MKSSFFAAAALAFLLSGLNTEVAAQPVPPGNPMLPQLAEISGAATAGIKVCDLDESMGPVKRQQKDQFIKMGGTPEQFETGYQAGYDRVENEYASASAGDRQKMCAELSAFLSAK